MENINEQLQSSNMKLFYREPVNFPYVHPLMPAIFGTIGGIGKFSTDSIDKSWFNMIVANLKLFRMKENAEWRRGFGILWKLRLYRFSMGFLCGTWGKYHGRYVNLTTYKGLCYTLVFINRI